MRPRAQFEVYHRHEPRASDFKLARAGTNSQAEIAACDAAQACGLRGALGPTTQLSDSGCAHDAESVVRTTTGLRFEKWTIAESVDAEVRKSDRYPPHMGKV